MALFTKNVNQESKAVSVADLSMVIDSCNDNLGEFYTLGIVTSLWWTAASTIYFAYENLAGQHAPSYIETMERRLEDGQSLAQYLIYWLQEGGNDPDLAEELDDIFKVIVTEPSSRTVRHDEMFEEVALFERFGLNESMTPLELDGVYDLASEWFKNERVALSRDPDATDAMKEFDETVRLILLFQTAAIESAKKKTRLMVENFEPTPISGLEPEYAYTLLVKIDKKIDGYLQKATASRIKTAREGNKKTAGMHSTNAALLRAEQKVINAILHEAGDADKTNTTQEIVDAAQNLLPQNLDVPANFEYNQEQNSPQ